MKKVISLFVILALFCSIFPCTVFAETNVNFLRTDLESAKCLQYDIGSNTVAEDSTNRFNQNGAINAITDGNTSVHADVYGGLDWEYPKYIGVLLTLNDVYDIENIKITSGLNGMADTYRVYAGTDFDALYTSASIIADGLVCENNTQTIAVNKQIKYIAVFCTAFSGNQRIKEIEAWGYSDEQDDIIPDVPSDDDITTGIRTSGTKIYMGDTPLTLRGVNIPQFSWSSYGDGSTAEGSSAAHIALNQAMNEWGCSIIRLAVDPNVYVNGGTGSGSGQSQYRTAAQNQALIDSFVTTMTNAGIVVVLDCHAYGCAYQNIVDFWNIAAPKYDNNELVIYGLLNEPTCQWQQWFEGGSVYAPHIGTVDCIGIPALLDKVRALSDNVVVIGGIDYAFDLSKIAEDGFNEFAASRAPQLGISTAEYKNRYSLTSGNRVGRGIVLDTHIYSGKPVNWDAYIGRAAEEFPILVGEYNPYFRGDFLTELTAEEKGFLQKIFHWINNNGFASTSWSLGAEPFLTDYNGNLTAIGVAVKEFVQTGKWNCEQDENLIYQHYASAKGIAQDMNGGSVFYDQMFINQAYLNGESVKDSILTKITDGETATHYDIYPWPNYYTGVEFELDNTYACHEIRMTSGLDGYPDKYKIYASDNIEDLYSSENLIENFTVEHTGTVRFKVNKAIKYVAFLGMDYVRIKEFSVSGVYIGDMNADSHFNSADLTALRKHIMGSQISQASMRGDLTRDGMIDVRDIITYKKELSK